MRNTSKTVLLVALLAGAFAAPQSIRNRLGQVNAKNLAQYGGSGGGSVGGGNSGSSLECDISALEDNFTLPSLPFTECQCQFNSIPGLGAAES
jgi:hypothetical protein